MFTVGYKIIFMGKDGKEKTIESDSYNFIRNIHANIKYDQHLMVSNILKPNQPKRWLASMADVVIFKKRGVRNAT